MSHHSLRHDTLYFMVYVLLQINLSLATPELDRSMESHQIFAHLATFVLIIFFLFAHSQCRPTVDPSTVSHTEIQTHKYPLHSPCYGAVGRREK